MSELTFQERKNMRSLNNANLLSNRSFVHRYFWLLEHKDPNSVAIGYVNEMVICAKDEEEARKYAYDYLIENGDLKVVAERWKDSNIVRVSLIKPRWKNEGVLMMHEKMYEYEEEEK